MFNRFLQKIILGSISFSLIVSNSYAKIGDVFKSCTEPVTTEFFPVGDTTGKSVLTKKQEIRECNITKTVQGKCIKWEEKNETAPLPSDKYNVFKTKDYSKTLGNLFSAIGAYNEIDHLWSGWHGYCEIGTASDFSWAEDPMFWSSLMLSAVLTAAGGGGESQASNQAAKEGAKEGAKEAAKTASQNIVTNAAAETGKATAGFLKGMGINSLDNKAKEAATEAVWEAMKKKGRQLTESEIKNIIAQATARYYAQIGTCLMSGAYNFAVSTYEFYNEMTKSKRQIPCDPVDEVCNGNDAGAFEDETIYTVDETQFNDIVTDFQNQGENIYDYIEIIQPSPDNGIVRYKYKPLNQVANITNSMNSDQLDKIKKKFAQIKYAMNLALTVGNLATCMTGFSSASVSIPTDTSDRKTDQIRSTVNQVADFAASFAPQPYGAIAAAAVKILAYTATSFQHIDACHDEKDAKNRDKRQHRTMLALKYNLCHFVKEECVETNFLDSMFGKDCSLHGYYYCCYDGLLTKILVEQMKAELGRDWAHCTGITLRDLNYISFRQCSNTEMKDGIDGAHQIGDYDPTQAFQYKHKCMDLSEFLDYLNNSLDLDMSPQDFKDYWNSITNDTNNIN